MLLTPDVDARRIPMHHFQTGMLRPNTSPQLSPLLPRQPLHLACSCPCIVRHDRPILCVVWAKTRPGRDSKNTLSNGVLPTCVQAVATNLRIDKTRAILVYGQDRASVMTAIACRVSLPLFSRSFWLLRRRPAPLGTRVETLNPSEMPRLSSTWPGLTPCVSALFPPSLPFASDTRWRRD